MCFRSFKTTNEKSGKKSSKIIETPIYSSVLKKKSNPARDFALTVLENDKKSVIKKVVVEQGTDNAGSGSSDLNEISQLLNSTNALLTRNSHLRASLTIKVQRSNSKKTTKTATFVLPKNVVQETTCSSETECSSNSSSASPSSSTASSDKCDTSEEESMPSLEPPVNPFSR